MSCNIDSSYVLLQVLNIFLEKKNTGIFLGAGFSF